MKQMLQIALITDQQSKEAQISEKSLQLIKQSLETLGHQWTHITRPSMRDEFLHSYENYDLAIPIIHGGIGEGGQIFALLEVLDIPYLFSDHTAHTLCFNKQRANVVVGEIGIQIPKSHYLSPGYEITIPAFSGPYFVKPTKSGSSLHCGVFQSRTDAQPLIQEILKEDEVCIQELIRGREFTVSLSSLNNDIQVLGIMEILTQKEFFDYDAKYSLDQTEEIFLSGESDLEQQLSQSAKQIFSAVGCKDVARIDFLYSQGTLYFLEVNTIPGMTPTSFYPQCVLHAGYPSFADFLHQLIQSKIGS